MTAGRPNASSTSTLLFSYASTRSLVVASLRSGGGPGCSPASRTTNRSLPVIRWSTSARTSQSGQGVPSVHWSSSAHRSAATTES